ncbi:MAG: DUF1109 domain-containing protein [Burkholderiales bacterium]|nr:DUF1109 domain-containing protein [Burkholderiales bacterium]
MKTDELIEALSRGPVEADARAPSRRLVAMVATGVAVSGVAMLVLLGPRADLVAAAAQPMFWMKVAFPLLLALPAFAAVARLGRPGESATRAWSAWAATLLLVEALALAIILGAPAGDRAALVTGRTALPCVVSIVLLALPILLAALAGLRGMAPTRPRESGAAAGLAAGALAGAVYALHCDESTLPFLAVWYVLGMAIPGALAAWAGPRLLRWA